MPIVSFTSIVLVYGTQNMCCLIPMVMLFSALAISQGWVMAKTSKGTGDNLFSIFIMSPIMGGILPFFPTIWLWFWGSAIGSPELTDAGFFYWNLTKFCAVLGIIVGISAHLSEDR